MDVVVAFNGTSGRITFYVDGSVHGVSEPQGAVPFSLPNFTSGPFSGNRDPTNTNNAYYGLNGYQETVTVWAGVAPKPPSCERRTGVSTRTSQPRTTTTHSARVGIIPRGGACCPGSQTDVVIADHITGDSAHALKWSGRFEQFREVPAESAADAEVCCRWRICASLGSRWTARASKGFSVTPC